MYQFFFLSAVIDSLKENLYFFGNNMKGFFSWNLISNEIELLDDMSEKEFRNGMYDCGIMVNDKIYFPPKNSYEVAIYELDKRKLRYVEMFTKNAINGICYKPEYLLGHFVIKKSNNELYFVCRQLPLVIKMNLLTEEFDYIYLDKYTNNDFFLANQFAVHNSIYYFPILNISAVLEININDDTVKVIDINADTKYGYTSCIWRDDKLVLLSRDSHCIVEFNIVTNRCKSVFINIEKGSILNSQILENKDDSIFIIPDEDCNLYGGMDCIYELDNSYKVIGRNDLFKNTLPDKKFRVFTEDDREWYFTFESTYHDFGDQFWIINLKLLILDMKQLTIEEKVMPMINGWTEEMISEKVVNEQSESYFRTYDGVLVENQRAGFKQFVNYIIQRER